MAGFSPLTKVDYGTTKTSQTGNILVLELKSKYSKLQKLVKEFKARAQSMRAPFSIILYGSASYGLNIKSHGNLDDVDS